MDLQKYIPFDGASFRPHQERAIKETIEALDDGIETIILNAPTGFGKSLVAYCICKALIDKGMTSYIYTKTTYLQDQYLNDFDDLTTAMGRSNFNCLMSEGDTCDVGRCKQSEKYKCPVGVLIEKSDIYLKDTSDAPVNQNCEYWKQKVNAIDSPISILNYPYAITDSMFVGHFNHRDFGVFDEAHSLEQTLMSALEVEVTDAGIYRDLGKSLPNHDNVEDWVDDLKDFAYGYKVLARKTEDIKRREHYLKRFESLEACAESLESDSDNWVFNSFSKRSKHLQRRVRHVTFKPIEIQDYTDIVFGKVNFKLLMSGSILKPDIYCHELGLEDFKYIEVPSIVPKNRRPIYREFVGSMSRRNIDENFPLLVSKIVELAEKHDEEKGLIHSHSYNINYRLYQTLHDNDRFIFHSAENRNEKLEEFKSYDDDEPYIFVSPYSFEGVDFPYGEARWQVICKMPYPYLGDAQVRARMDADRRENVVDYGWCNRMVALNLSQMYGRTNRATDDYSVTYLLDSDINRYLGPATLVTDYFLEGVVDYNYDTELEPVDISKLRSRGINRENQTIIFNDIKEGYNTMNKLRRAYKQLPGGSFTMVKPAVDYMLSCGAVRYAE